LFLEIARAKGVLRLIFFKVCAKIKGVVFYVKKKGEQG